MAEASLLVWTADKRTCASVLFTRKLGEEFRILPRFFLGNKLGLKIAKCTFKPDSKEPLHPITPDESFPTPLLIPHIST